ncbi:50S ribosome-binding protein YggL [Azotobacter vinelandii]|uniref:50S ribosome-binding protein YggL n=1 Tax=Azotobacter TaxID=352 RepID=UPI0009D6401A
MSIHCRCDRSQRPLVRWRREWFRRTQRHVSATELHREMLRTWLKTRPEIISVRVGPLVDAWYPDQLS